MSDLAARVDRVLRAAGVAIESVSIGDDANRATWLVQPAALQAQAQPWIDAFVAPTEEQLIEEAAQRDIDAARAQKTTVFWVLRRLLGRTPTAAERQAARDEWIAIYKALA